MNKIEIGRVVYCIEKIDEHIKYISPQAISYITLKSVRSILHNTINGNCRNLITNKRYKKQPIKEDIPIRVVLNKPYALSKDEYLILKNLKVGEKTSREINWIINRDGTMTLKRLREQKLITTYKDEYNKKYHNITEEGSKKINEYILTVET